MEYRKYQDLNLSAMGFGAMRLPCLADGSIDEPQVQQMVDYAMENGVNYFDTAYPYHGGKSEIVMGKALSKYPRESYYLADKYPGHQIASTYNPAAIFEEQLEKCGVEYFDFYLLHNVCENSMGVYMDPKWGILDYFKEQKRLGRIKHLGFSTHAMPENLKTFLDYAGKDMEFCQIQLNYLDWTLQKGKEKVDMLNEAGIPIWVMESVRGGKLANLPADLDAQLKELRPGDSAASWGYRWLLDVPGVTVILSGVSNFEQLKDNVGTFSDGRNLSASESALLREMAETMKAAVPCTACRYCTAGCPKGLDIPALIAGYNDMKFNPTFTVSMAFEVVPAEKQPAACIGCGKCARICPQHIDIPDVMTKFADLLAKTPKWADICREREEAAKRARG